ncbi:fimbrial biogenesis chaperone [Yersinia enterocolitica]|uniref:fimbrial biogenesis chaperone n=1 Tax=Yersinia enterocolitica TaxID=630 RepID=UPI000976F834|nr:molecular chaperone [Yersinia enterocolitica]ELI7922722.1 molecular chaperone [Yersinia enterocolitica]
MKLPKVILTGLLLLGANLAHASVQIMATRIIFDEQEKEQVIRVNNMGNIPSLTQVWLESDTDTQNLVEKEDLTFVFSPPVSRINAGKGKTFRVFKTDATKGKFASDRETMLWLNVLDIPPEADNKSGNKLNFAIRTKIKFFYRPTDLKSTPENAAEKITWSTQKIGNKIHVKGTNDNPYHVSMAKLSLVNANEAIELPGGVIKPYSSAEFVFDAFKSNASDFKFNYTYITDLGAFVQKEVALKT